MSWTSAHVDGKRGRDHPTRGIPDIIEKLAIKWIAALQIEEEGFIQAEARIQATACVRASICFALEVTVPRAARRHRASAKK